MGRYKETAGKKDVRNKQAKKRKEKELKRQEKKEQGKKGSMDDMLAFVDENGNISSTPPDLTKKKKISAENIETSVPKSDFRVNNKIKTGRVNNFDENKGFGFIVDDKTRQSIFVHVNDCHDEINTGSRVEFETQKGTRGLKAVNVRVI